ncbi:MAG: metallophosphoesterase [Saprospiraceae bacterium]|nr:metallophosphoesterase [Saprospiraceae bacterium]
MLVLFITDLHTSLKDEYPHDIDLRQNFLDVLRVTKRYNYDFLVLGGDLCFKDGDSQIYRWQKSHLDRTNKPYFIIPGNHDDQGLLNEIFPEFILTGDDEIYYKQSLGGKTMLFLDTARGRTSVKQQDWLREELDQLRNQRVTLFMHHPPMLMQVPHMDKNYALQDRNELMAILKETANPKDVFCGHYHVCKSGMEDQISVHITPSLFFQIDQYEKEFAVDHLNIGYRLIRIENHNVLSGVHYLTGNRKA